MFLITSPTDAGTGSSRDWILDVGAADRLDLGARHRLVIGDDRQRLDGGAGELAQQNNKVDKGDTVSLWLFPASLL